MKMQTLFASVFNEEMKARGYKKKGKLYYRLNGDILQGVIIKTINPYTIHFYAAPYWTKNVQMEWSSITKGYWAEEGLEVSPGLDAYYREENEELNLAYMNACFEVAKTHILPVLDEICDLDSYFEHLVPNWTLLNEEDRSKRFIKFDIKEIDNNFPQEDAEIKIYWDLWLDLDRHIPFVYYGCMHNDLNKGYELLKEIASRMPATNDAAEFAKRKYAEFLMKNDLETAKKYFAERKEIMLKRLSEEMKLDISHL